VNAAADKVIFAHASVVPLLAKVAGQFATVERYVVVDDTGRPRSGRGAGPFAEVCHYESLLEGLPSPSGPSSTSARPGP